jgi:hypothetical protein
MSSFVNYKFGGGDDSEELFEGSRLHEKPNPFHR